MPDEAFYEFAIQTQIDILKEFDPADEQAIYGALTALAATLFKTVCIQSRSIEKAEEVEAELMRRVRLLDKPNAAVAS